MRSRKLTRTKLDWCVRVTRGLAIAGLAFSLVVSIGFYRMQVRMMAEIEQMNRNLAEVSRHNAMLQVEVSMLARRGDALAVIQSPVYDKILTDKNRIDDLLESNWNPYSLSGGAL